MKTIEKAKITAVKAEHLDDIIFEGRNQSYGAYQLRKSYNSNLNLSAVIVLSFAAAVISLAFIHSMVSKPAPKIEQTPIIIKVDLSGNITPETPELPKQIAKASVPNNNANTDGPPEVVENDDQVTDQPKTAEDLNLTSGSATVPPEVQRVDPPVTKETPTDDVIFDPGTVTIQAGFKKGSIDDFRKWLAKNINYPEDAVSSDVKGKVILQFTIDKTGKLTDIKVIKGIHPVIDKAAAAALSKSPMWTAATYKNEPVKVSYIIPIAFCIQK
jgi:periplasmic protein TonB